MRIDVYPDGFTDRLRNEIEKFDAFHRERRGSIDKIEERLLESLKIGRFWYVLSSVDGYRSYLDSQSVKERGESKVWARERFTEEELEKLLELVVNTALHLGSENTNWSGTRKGHSILYESVVDAEDSMFKDAITDGLRVRLNNGRFWEELGDLRSGINMGVPGYVVDTVLTEHRRDLDVSFAPKGVELFRMNRIGEVDLHLISDEGINAYIDFMRRIAPFLKEEDMEILVAPYVVACLADREDDIRFEDFAERLKDPFVKGYLGGSNHIRDELAYRLALETEFGSPYYDNLGMVVDVLKAVPEMPDMVERTSGRIKDSDRRARLMDRLKREDI